MTNEVETGEDFRVLLRRLIARFEGLGSGAPEVDDLLLRWAGLLPDRAPEPGWPGLADQLLRAVDAPSAGHAEPAPLAEEPPVASSGELRVLLRTLAADYARARAWTRDRVDRGLWAGDSSGWASGSTARFLESWESWLGDSLGRPARFPGTPPLEPVNWASVAWQLGAARVYE
ncbi:hypothetical protein ACIA8O_30710 [Kitasatospora sp. NPDC051853]|uniref:hypothetical protein n=1 Tax=Kitasatospora sp. NPDC051853 TaxID=3364058 RepID=UPI0037B9154B